MKNIQHVVRLHDKDVLQTEKFFKNVLFENRFQKLAFSAPQNAGVCVCVLTD